MEGELTPKERLVYNKVNLDSYKRFFDQSQDFPFDTQTPLETVVEYYDYIVEMLDSIEIPTKFQQAIKDKDVLLENLNDENLTTEKAVIVIDRLYSITECVNDVIERRSK